MKKDVGFNLTAADIRILSPLEKELSPVEKNFSTVEKNFSPVEKKLSPVESSIFSGRKEFP